MSGVIRELDQRTDHGITVTLFWNVQTNRTFVAVVEDPHGVSFEFEVPGTDQPKPSTTPTPTQATTPSSTRSPPEMASRCKWRVSPATRSELLAPGLPRVGII